MLRFDPPELQKQLADALNALEDVVCIYHFHPINEEDFDPSSVKDDEVITRATELEECRLWSTDDTGFSTTVGELIEWVEMLSKYKLKDRRSLRLDGETLFYVEGFGTDEHSLASAVSNGKAKVAQEIKIDGGRYTARLLCGFTKFALFIEKQGRNDRDYIHTYYDTTPYVQIMHPQDARDDTIESVAHAFLFELASAGAGCFRINSYPSDDDVELYEVDGKNRPTFKLRPMKVGVGLRDVHDLYLAGCSATPAEYALIHFVKVIEYVSATVVRLARHDALRRRLASKAALSPGADFLDGLAALLEEQRIFNKDAEAIKLTVQTCCDPAVFAGDSPKFLQQLRKLRFDDDAKVRKAAVDEFSACLSATRNQLSHAKANYALTGAECPTDELVELTACARAAADQVIRWYAALPDHARVA